MIDPAFGCRRFSYHGKYKRSHTKQFLYPSWSGLLLHLVSSSFLSQFSMQVISWYAVNGRELPYRGSHVGHTSQMDMTLIRPSLMWSGLHHILLVHILLIAPAIA